jgi:hypothetical protein
MSHGPLLTQGHEMVRGAVPHAVGMTAAQTPSHIPTRVDNARDRRFLISFNGSLADLAADPSRAVCTVASDGTAAQLFGIASSASNGLRVGDLSAIRVTTCEASKQHSTFPIPMALDISGIRGSNYALNGQRTGLQVFPGTCNTPETLMADSAMLTSEFAAQYPGITASNLTTHGITRLPSGMHLVAANHPVIGMLKLNRNVLTGNDSLSTVRMVEGCYPISEETVQYVIGALHSEVCTKFPDLNLEQKGPSGGFGGTLTRADGRPMLSTEGLAHPDDLHKVGSLSVVVRMAYQLPMALE